MIPYENKRKLNALILRLLENNISDQEIQELDEFFSANPDLIRYYCDFVINYNAVRVKYNNDRGLAEADASEDSVDKRLWDALADEEKTAPIVEIPAVPTGSEEQKITSPHKEHPKVSKFSIYSLLLSSAALIFVMVYAFFVSMRRGVEVATLTDSMNAQWADATSSMEKGARVVTGNDRWLLREGYAELLFDNQTRVTLEGPVEFQILAEDRIGLNYGKVYATVPKEAVGFSVYTHNAKIIDLGTGFGVQAEIGGTTQLHVLKGKTMLMAGKTDRVNMEVGQGNARKVSGETGEVSEIGCRSDYFIRVINSESNCIWKGQNQINLADIVGGGNGFGTGRFNYGIHPATGEWGNITTANRPLKNNYTIIPQNPFVDGIFVPNGNDPQIVSSLGHVFQECPSTQGIYFMEVINTPTRLDGQAMILNDIRYGTDGNSCLFMHANLGITFDLDAIRLRFPGARIVRFQSQIGISETALRECNADFWVLVDGKVRYKREQVQQKGLLDTLHIEFSDTDRFLTLVTTDGGDPDARELPDGFIRRSIDCDWGIFGNPVLVLE